MIIVFFTITNCFYVSLIEEDTNDNADDTSHNSNLSTTKRKETKRKAIDWFQSIFIKYWILLSSITLLLMSCVSPVVVYRIVYMILFLYFIVTFHVFYSFWRASLYYFHSIVVVY